MKAASELKLALEAHLEKIGNQAGWDAPLYAPMAYILALGGKRIRPMLLLMSYQAMSGRDGSECLNTATAVEFFHNFSLMHDDIMDNAPVRRGKPTVHEKWDSNTAILSGDAMFALAYQFLIQDFPQYAAALLREFSKVALGVCEGQMEDMEMAGKLADIPQYIEMIRKKTAMLIGGSLSIGAIAAGADAQTVHQLYALGEKAGIAFQLQDDFLDVYAKEAKFGKQVGGDILENKMTFLLIRCIEKADEGQKKRLDHLLYEEKSADKKIAGVMELYAELGIPAETEAEMDRYFQAAEELAAGLRDRKGFELIDHFLKALAQRDHWFMLTNPTILKFLQAPVASFIFVLTIVTSIMAFNDSFLKEKLIMRPYAFIHRKQYFTLITSGLIHSDYRHLAMNMLTFWFFAFPLEHMMVLLQVRENMNSLTGDGQAWLEILGHTKFLLIYLISMVVADITTIPKYKDYPGYATLGASGAISGIVIPMIILAPSLGYSLKIFGIIPGWIYVIAFMTLSYIASKRSQDNINHDAHLWGALGGMFFTPVFFPKETWFFIEQLRDTMYGWMS